MQTGLSLVWAFGQPPQPNCCRETGRGNPRARTQAFFVGDPAKTNTVYYCAGEMLLRAAISAREYCVNDDRILRESAEQTRGNDSGEDLG